MKYIIVNQTYHTYAGDKIGTWENDILNAKQFDFDRAERVALISMLAGQGKCEVKQIS
ncbi:MAG: hypothetical protein GY754_25130 [bacterium]|nr:hypothetical protein [bacterium]